MKKLTKIYEDAPAGIMTFDDLLSAVRSKLSGFTESSGQYFGPERFGKTYEYRKAEYSGDSQYYSFTSDKQDDSVEINFESKKIIKGASLADPRARYQTTSATRYKTDKKSVKRTAKDPKSALAAFEQFLAKVS